MLVTPPQLPTCPSTSSSSLRRSQRPRPAPTRPRCDSDANAKMTLPDSACTAFLTSPSNPRIHLILGRFLLAASVVAYATLTRLHGQHPARTGTHRRPPQTCQLPMEVDSCRRHQWQRLNLPLCLIHAGREEYQGWQVHLSSSSR